MAKGETVYNGKGGLRFLLWCRFLGGMRGRDVGVQRDWYEFAGSRTQPMKPSSDRSVRVCTEGGSAVGG